MGPLGNGHKLHPVHHPEGGEPGATVHCIIIRHLRKWKEARPVLLLIGDVASRIALNHGICPFGGPVGSGVERRAQACFASKNLGCLENGSFSIPNFSWDAVRRGGGACGSRVQVADFKIQFFSSACLKSLHVALCSPYL